MLLNVRGTSVCIELLNNNCCLVNLKYMTLTMADSSDTVNSVNEQLNDSFGEPGVHQKSEKTFVSGLHELVSKFNFGLPMYNLVKEQGDPHKKKFYMSLTVNTLGISVLGSGVTKMQSKHNAAYKMMLQIRKTAHAAGTLNNVPNQTLLDFCEWMKKTELLTEEIPHQLTEPTNSAGILTGWLLDRHHSLPTYDVLKTCGPAHSRIYFMSCKLDHHRTEGEGKSKKVAKNLAAEKMLRILQSDDSY